MIDLDTPMPDLEHGTAALLGLARTVPDFTRADVMEVSGWGRMTVQARVEELLDHKMVTEAAPSTGQRGRPAIRYRFNSDRAVLVVADIGASGARVAVCDLVGRVIHKVEVPTSIGDGPEAVLAVIMAKASTLLDTHRHGRALWGVGISVPGPVEIATGRVVSPPIMTGWDGFEIPRRVQQDLGPVPVFVDNDAMSAAWGERQRRHPTVSNLVYVKVGTGVGAGIVANGQPLRGAKGAAGDLGHTWADCDGLSGQRPLCRCGKVGCVEAYCGGWALARDLEKAGFPCRDAQDVVELVRLGNAQAIRLVRDAGRVLGAAIAEAVSLVNPSVVIIGGQLSATGEHLIGGVRERVAARSLPLAVDDLVIETTALNGDSGVIGLAHSVADTVLGVALWPLTQGASHPLTSLPVGLAGRESLVRQPGAPR